MLYSCPRRRCQVIHRSCSIFMIMFTTSSTDLRDSTSLTSLSSRTSTSCRSSERLRSVCGRRARSRLSSVTTARSKSWCHFASPNSAARAGRALKFLHRSSLCFFCEKGIDENKLESPVCAGDAFRSIPLLWPWLPPGFVTLCPLPISAFCCRGTRPPHAAQTAAAESTAGRH